MWNESLEFFAPTVQILRLTFGRTKAQHGNTRLDGLHVDSGTIRGESETSSHPSGQVESDAVVRCPRCATHTEPSALHTLSTVLNVDIGLIHLHILDRMDGLWPRDCPPENCFLSNRRVIVVVIKS